MSPLKKIISKITGQPGCDDQPLLVRGFGKLPLSREFLQIEVWQGAAIVQNWIKSGHDGWITRFKPATRGCICPYLFSVDLAELRGYTVLGGVWNSCDAASPARAFPFSLFVLLPRSASPGWVEHLMVADHYWRQLEPLFDGLGTGEVRLPELRDRVLPPPSDVSNEMVEVQNQAASIPFKVWLGDLARQSQAPDPDAYLNVLRTHLRGWKAHPRDLALRLPISRAFPYRPQIAAWLQWLSRNLADAPLRGLLVPQTGPGTEPALTVLTRPTTADDFQLLTTNVHDYQAINDYTVIPTPTTTQPGSTEGIQAGVSLWSWATEE